MASLGTGNATPEKRKARNVLSLRDPRIERLLGGLGIERHQLAELRQFCKDWTRARSQWDIDRRKSGLFSVGRISKSDADIILKRQLAALEGGGV